jgi:hypothetical protein
MSSFTDTPYIDMAAGIAAAIVAATFVASVIGLQAFIEHRRHMNAEIAEARWKQRTARAAVDSVGALSAERDSLQRVADLRHPDTRWIARVIYSESDRADEQELVAWVVRNRKEMHFRNKKTFRQVALDPYQFSAFNRSRANRDYFMTLNTSDIDTTESGQRWLKALEVANRVRKANQGDRPEIVVEADSTAPMPMETFYFYSQISMPGHRHAPWAHRFDQVRFAQPVDDFRFRFYQDRKCRGCGRMFYPEAGTASGAVASAR